MRSPLFVNRVTVRTDVCPNLGKREVVMGAPEVLEVINSFRTPIFIPVVRVKQVRFCGKLSPEPSPQVDVESEAHEEREIVKQEYFEQDESKPIKQEQTKPPVTHSASVKQEYFEPEESKPIKQERSPSPDPDQKPTPSAINTNTNLGKRKHQSEISAEKRARIAREVLEDHLSPGDLSKKYNISAHAIRDWVKKTGYQLPKSYKRFQGYKFSFFKDIKSPRSKQNEVVEDGKQQTSATVPEPVPSLMVPPPPAMPPVQALKFFGDSGSARPPNPETWWSVLDGIHCSLLQCPECPRKLQLRSLNNHLVGKEPQESRELLNSRRDTLQF